MPPLPRSTKLLVVGQHRPSLDVVDVVPTHKLELIKVQGVLNSVDVVIVQDITSMVVGQDCLTTRAILQGLAHARNMLKMSITYDVIMAAVDDVATTVLEVNTIAIDERSRG